MKINDLAPMTINGFLIAGPFIALSMIVAFLNGIIAFPMPIWTIIATAIVLPLAIPKLKIKPSMDTLLGAGLSIAIVGIIAAFVPALVFLYEPFTASVTGIIGLVAVIMHMLAAVALAGIVKAKIKM